MSCHYWSIYEEVEIQRLLKNKNTDSLKLLKKSKE